MKLNHFNTKHNRYLFAVATWAIVPIANAQVFLSEALIFEGGPVAGYTPLEISDSQLFQLDNRSTDGNTFGSQLAVFDINGTSLNEKQILGSMEPDNNYSDVIEVFAVTTDILVTYQPNYSEFIQDIPKCGRHTIYDRIDGLLQPIDTVVNAFECETATRMLEVDNGPNRQFAHTTMPRIDGSPTMWEVRTPAQVVLYREQAGEYVLDGQLIITQDQGVLYDDYDNASEVVAMALDNDILALTVERNELIPALREIQVYERSAEGWALASTLNAPALVESESDFGQQLEFLDGVLVVFSENEQTSAPFYGSLRTYQKAAGGWSAVSTIKPEDVIDCCVGHSRLNLRFNAVRVDNTDMSLLVDVDRALLRMSLVDNELVVTETLGYNSFNFNIAQFTADAGTVLSSGTDTIFDSIAEIVTPFNVNQWRLHNVGTCDQTLMLEPDAWRIISLPCYLPNSERNIAAIFGDDMPGTRGTNWEIYAYDPIANDYVAPSLNESLKLGQGYWVIQISDEVVEVDLQKTASERTVSVQAGSEKCFEESGGCLNTAFSTPPEIDGNSASRWRLLGNPRSQHTAINSLGISSDACLPLCEFTDTKVPQTVLTTVFAYDGSVSETYTSKSLGQDLSPWEGFWVGLSSDDFSGNRVELVVPEAPAPVIDLVSNE